MPSNRILREDIELEVGTSLVPVAYSRLSPSSVRFEVHPMAAVLMTMFDGTRSDSEVMMEFAKHTGWTGEDSNAFFEMFEARYSGFLVQAQGRTRSWDAGLLTAIATASEPSPSRRPEMPLNLNWIVTEFCNRRCVYCYNSPQSKHLEKPSARLSRARLHELFREAYLMGIRTVRLTGGEPFMVNDLVQTIVDIVENGMTPDITTKWFFDDASARELSAAGLRSIILSIDSVIPSTGDYLVGVPGYVCQALSSIDTLLRSGISVSISTVVTKANLDEIPDLAAHMRHAGAHQVLLHEYQVSYGGRCVPELLLDDEDRARIRDTAVQNSDIIRVVSLRDEATEKTCGSGICDLSFLPDGLVTLCDHLPLARLDGAIYGDLRVETIAEVWRRFPHVFSADRYRGTECYQCRNFVRCTARGRCIEDALRHSGTLFGPHGRCPERFARRLGT